MTVRRYRILVGGKAYDVEVGDTSATPIPVVVNGVTYQITLPARPQAALRPIRPPAVLPPRPPSLAAGGAAATSPAGGLPGVAGMSAPGSPAGIPAPAAPIAGGAHAVTAQMPGKVVSVAAKPGDELRRGQPICVIESMKMELTIAAPRDCKVTAVRIAPGEAVRNGQVLAEIE